MVYVRSVAGVSNSNNLTVNGVPVQYIYVSVNGNDNNNGSKNAPVRTIAKAISLNTNGIYILEGNYREYGLNINSDLKIVGDGKVIIGGISSADPVFKISNSANVSFNNLKFADISNGEIINGLAAGEVEISGCEFYSNNQKGILVNVANLLISDSKFENNNVFKCIYTNYLEMRNCEFVNNTANEKKSTSEVGNLIYLDLKDQQGIISGTFFENNNVYQGCIYVKSSDFNQGLEIADSVFINNTGVFRGGCLYADSSSSSNYPITISSSVFIDNFAQSGSVAFVMKKCVLTATNSIFLGNKEKSSSLGEVFSTVGSSAKFAIDSNWWGNTAENATTAPRKGLNNWLFLNVTGNVDKLNFNENGIVTVDLANVINSNGEISKYDAGDKLPLDTLNITSVNGITTTVGDKFVDGKIQVIFTPTATGEASVTTNLYGVTSTIKFNVGKTLSDLHIYTNDIKVNEDLVIKVALESSRPTGTVTVNINNKSYTINLVNGTGFTTISGLAIGEYEITAKYNGDDNYEEAIATSSVKVNKIASSMDITVDITDVTTIVADLPKDATGKVIFTVDNKTKNANIKNGKAYIVLFDLDDGVHTVHAVYGGDNNYFGCEASEQFSKTKLNSTLTVNANDAKVGEDVVVSVIVMPAPGSDGSSVNITIGDKSTIVKVDKDTGKASLKVSDLAAGNYTVKVVYSGNGLYNGCENTTNIKITGYSVPQWGNDGFDTKNTGKTNYTGNSNGVAIWNYVVSGSQINGSMAIDNAGNIYVACNDGIYSFTSNGTLRWKFEGSFGREISSGIAISRDVIIAPKAGDAIYFINSTTGKKYNSNIWQGSSIFSPVVDENANVYISSEYQYSSGSYNLVIIPYNMWKYGGTPTMIDLGSQPVSAPTLLGNGLVAVNTKDGLKIINVTSKTVIGSFVGIGVVGRPVVDSSDVIYVFDKDGKVNALSANNKLWTTEIAINGSTLALDEENSALYTVGSDGNVYKIDIFNKGAASVFYNLGGNASSIMIDNDGTVYIGSDNGKVSAITSEAKLLWTFTAESPIKGPIVMDKNGTVYVYSSKTVYAVGMGKITPAIDVNAEDVKVGEDVIINIELPDDATGSVEVVIGNITQNVNIKDGKASVTIANLSAGQYSAAIQYSGDNKYNGAKTDVLFNVNKHESKVDISADDIEIGKTAVVTINVTPGATGNVTVVVNGKSQVVELKDSKATLTIENLAAGDYKVEAIYNGDAKYLASSNNASFKVSKISGYDIKVNAGEVNEGEDATIIVVLPKDATGNVTLVMNNKPYFAKVSDGMAKVVVPSVSAGTHDFIVNYSGDDKYDKSTVNGTIKVNKKAATLIVEDLVKYYKGDEKLTAKLVDGRGNPIANADVAFNINGKDYIRKTNNEGIASMNINLVAGTYNVAVKYNESSVNVTVTVKSTIVADDLVKMYQDPTRFYAKFLDSTGKALANTQVRFNINGVFYTKTTNNDGVADLGIMLRPGTYILTAYNPANGEERGITITVKSLIVQSDLTKYYLNASRFQATIYNKDGSLAVNKEVTFNINGVFYHKTTDSNGVASLGIALRPGEYIITTIVDGLDIGNKVTVLPTLVTKDLDMKYLDGSDFTAQTLDGQGKPLANQNVSFNVNGVFYHKVTNEDGIASLKIRLMSGEYIITSSWNNFQTGNTIKISP